MKHFLLAVLLSCHLVSAQAAPPSDQSINEMMAALQIEKMVDQMLTQTDAGMKQAMDQALQQSLHGKELTANQKAELEKFQGKLSATIREELSFPKLKDAYLQVYRETFTQEEVNSIIAFYGSPAGKAMVEKIPLTMRKANTLLQPRLGTLTQKMQAMQEAFMKELGKEKAK